MKFDEVVKERHCTREFKSKNVKFEDILEAVDSALQGPFAGNLNNLKFVIIEDEKTIGEIAKFANQLWINTSPALIVVCSDPTHLENQYGERGKDYSKHQAGAAINTLLLKLTDLGINSCWVGSMDYDLIKQHLKIPNHIHIEALIPIGYEKGKSKKPRKHSLETAIYWEKWQVFKRPNLFQEAPARKR